MRKKKVDKEKVMEKAELNVNRNSEENLER